MELATKRGMLVLVIAAFISFAVLSAAYPSQISINSPANSTNITKNAPFGVDSQLASSIDARLNESIERSNLALKGHQSDKLAANAPLQPGCNLIESLSKKNASAIVDCFREVKR